MPSTARSPNFVSANGIIYPIPEVLLPYVAMPEHLVHDHIAGFELMKAELKAGRSPEALT